MTLRGSFAKRTSRLLAAACAFCVMAPALFAEELLICPSCGREGEAGQTACSTCGAAFRASSPEPVPEPGKEEAGGAATSALASATADVAEARRVRDGDVALALVLYRNAQALLAADGGAGFQAGAARKLAEELKAVRDGFAASVAPVARQAALTRAQRKAEDYFRGAGRTPCGRAWVPLDWPQALAPAALAAVRHALRPACAACGGEGLSPCKACGGAGRVPCRAAGCRNGWVSRKPTNSLTPKTDIVIREKCPVCRGSAFAACTDCVGRGAAACKKCGGTGDAPVCATCRGSGLEPCKDCSRKPNGPGCVLCKGTGQMLCRKCGGDGRTPH